jgi:hypothetical protein
LKQIGWKRTWVMHSQVQGDPPLCESSMLAGAATARAASYTKQVTCPELSLSTGTSI